MCLKKWTVCVKVYELAIPNSKEKGESSAVIYNIYRLVSSCGSECLNPPELCKVLQGEETKWCEEKRLNWDPWGMVSLAFLNVDYIHMDDIDRKRLRKTSTPRVHSTVFAGCFFTHRRVGRPQHHSTGFFTDQKQSLIGEKKSTRMSRRQ